MPKVNHICQEITKRFRLKTRSWQVSVLIDITYKKRDVYAIASTNIGKNLRYQAIPVVLESLVLVFSSKISLIEDLVRAPS